MRLIDWQVYWKSWGLLWKTSPYDSGYEFNETLVIIGPLQMRFWS